MYAYVLFNRYYKPKIFLQKKLHYGPHFHLRDKVNLTHSPQGLHDKIICHLCYHD